MTTLFDILDGIIDNAGDMVNDREEVESALSLDNIDAYAENGMNVIITSEQAESIRAAGLDWIKQVNEGNGEWSRMRDEAKRALDEEVAA